MAPTKSSPSVMNKYNTLAVIIVGIAFIYVWKIESTPKPPLDRTVSPKSFTGTSETKTITPPQATDSTPQVGEVPQETPSVNNTGSSVPSGQSGSVSLSPEDDDTSVVSNVPPPSVPTSNDLPTDPATVTQSGTTLSGVITYYNSYLDYGMSLPKGSYYAGYGGQDGAAHTMGFATGTGVTSFEEAPIKLWYYPNKLLPELRNGENSFYQNPGTNMTYLQLGNGTIRIEGNMEDPVILKIIQTVNRGD